MTYIILLYLLGMILMWGFIELLDDASMMRHHIKNEPQLPLHRVDEKIFLCLIWPVFSLIYVAVAEMQWLKVRKWW